MNNKIEQLVEKNEKLKSFKKQLKLDITSEGLRIQIIDDQNRPMFDSGGAAMKSYTRDVLREIGKTLNDLPNRISLSGHTDAVQYSTGERGYSNWELSADRANASRRELVAGGLEDGKIMRVVGLGSAVPFNKDDVNDPVNRRISIIVMNKKAEEAINKEAGTRIEAASAKEVETKLEQQR
jgi:chemotaxis protein MotB